MQGLIDRGCCFSAGSHSGCSPPGRAVRRLADPGRTLNGTLRRAAAATAITSPQQRHQIHMPAGSRLPVSSAGTRWAASGPTRLLAFNGIVRRCPASVRTSIR